jgi:hypothetical protein
MTAETITISVKEFKQLLEDSTFLNCLFTVGVDSWAGYDEAIQLLEVEKKNEPF